MVSFCEQFYPEELIKESNAPKREQSSLKDGSRQSQLTRLQMKK